MILELRGRSTARSAREQPLGVAGEVDAEVEQSGRDVLTVDLDVALLQVPAARTHEEHRDLVVQRVALLALLERDRALDGVREVLLAADDVRPGRRVRVLEVRHVDARTRVERVDDHLAVAGRAGDLDAAVPKVGRHWRHSPVAFADRARRLEEVGELPSLDPLLARGAGEEQLLAPVSELALERDDEVERLQVRTPASSGAETVASAVVLTKRAPPRTAPPRSSP